MKKFTPLSSVTGRSCPVLYLLIISFFTISHHNIKAQTAPDLNSCYAVADEFMGNANTDALVVINNVTGTSQVIGTGTGTAGMEAIAFVPQIVGGTIQQVLFGVADPTNPNTTSANTLGTIDLMTGSWTALPNPISTSAPPGSSSSDSWDIDGLTWDAQCEILWATQRNSGDGNPDYLLQIDPTTGMLDPAFTPVVIPLATDMLFMTSGNLPYDDIDDLAIDPTTGRMYAIMNKGGVKGGLVELDPATGMVLNYIGLFTGTTSMDGFVDDMEGLSFSNTGQLYGSTANNGPDPGEANSLFAIDKNTAATTLVGSFPSTDIEALGCLTTPVDRIELIPTFEPIEPFCILATPPSLPTTSTNGISGLWNPATINSEIAGTASYTFTPDELECAEPITMSVTILDCISEPIPTMGEWGLICLSLLLLIFGVKAVEKRSNVIMD